MNKDFFNSEAWLRVLEQGFGCSHRYLLAPDLNAYAAVNLFPFGPLRIGYLGFPIGLCAFNCTDASALMSALCDLEHPVGFDLLRCSISEFDHHPMPGGYAHKVPETTILDLGSWKLETLPKRTRRDVYRARREGFQLLSLESSKHAPEIHHLYVQTVRRHGGAPKYNLAYFEALLSLASRAKEAMRIFAAARGGRIVAFLCAVISGDTAYYLHGASDRIYGRFASDFLQYHAICWTQAQGAKCYNLLGSPPDQPGVVRFKEKWGGVTRGRYVYEIPFSRLGSRLIRMGQWIFSAWHALWR